MKKRVIKSVFIILFTLLMSACGSKIADIERIKTDIEKNNEYTVIAEGESIDELEINDRDLDKKNGTDEIKISIISHDSEKNYKKNALVKYHKNSDGEWVIAGITVDSRNKWEISPQSEPSDDMIKKQLIGQRIVVDGEEWSITDASLSEFNVKTHDTELENFKDTVAINVTLNDVVERLKSDIILDYQFDDGWKLNCIERIENTNIEQIPSMESIVNEGDLIEVFLEEKYKYGDLYSVQDISINKDEIYNFVLSSQNTTNKGTVKNFDCSFKVNKNGIGLAIDSTVEYKYETDYGWKRSILDKNVKVESADIDGIWMGECGYWSTPDIVTLEIHKDEKGDLIGTYKYEDRLHDYVGEYSITGEIDKDTLKIRLDAGEWITKPKKAYGNVKRDSECVFYVDKGTIEGKGHSGNPFKLSRVE